MTQAPCCFSNPHALCAHSHGRETISKTPLSSTLFSVHLQNRATSHYSQATQARHLEIDWKGSSTHTGTFQDNTNDKNRHLFSFKYTLWNDQAGLQPCRPAPKRSFQHHMSRPLILNTAKCWMAKAVLLN